MRSAGGSRARAAALTRDVAVALRTVLTVLLARLVLRRGGLPAAVRSFRLVTLPPGEPVPATGSWGARSRRRARVAGRVLRVPGLRGTCLPTALSLASVLGAGGVPADVVIGVSSENGFSAHAWVELPEGRIDLAGHPLSAHRAITRLRPARSLP